MTGLDTNILARLLLQDHKEQALLADDAIFDIVKHGGKSYINIIVLCELLWLLEARYGYTAQNLAEIIEMLIHNDDFVVEDSALVAQALHLYKTAKADFADILIGLRNRQAGCADTLTFDKQAAKLDEFTLLS